METMHLCAIRAHFLHAHQASLQIHFRYHLNIFNSLTEGGGTILLCKMINWLLFRECL